MGRKKDLIIRMPTMWELKQSSLNIKELQYGDARYAGTNDTKIPISYIISNIQKK